MPAPAPHFHLLAEAKRHKRCGNWRFVLQTPDGRCQLEANDAEPETSGERLELLAIVRGLEALEQPSRVTLLTGSSSVSKGLRYGLEDWRSNDWQWERHGEMVPVKNSDLWQRIDRALQFHEVDCKVWRVDKAHRKTNDANQPIDDAPSTIRFRPAADGQRRTKQNDRPAWGRASDLAPTSVGNAATSNDSVRRESSHSRRWRWLCGLRRIGEALGRLRLRIAQLGTGILPRPWLE